MSETSGWSSPDGSGGPPPVPTPGTHWAPQQPPAYPPPAWNDAPPPPPPPPATPPAWSGAPAGQYAPPPPYNPGYGPHNPGASGPAPYAPQWSGWVAQRPPEVKPGVVPLRPLGVGEILDGAISTMRRHWKLQLGLSAAVVTVTSIMQFAVLWLLFDKGVATVGDTGLTGDSAADLSAAANVVSALAGIVGMLAQLVLTGFLSIVVSRAVLGQDVTTAEAWAAARGRRWRLVGMSAVVLGIVVAAFVIPIGLGVAVGAGAGAGAGIATGIAAGVACLVGAVWLYVSFGVAAPAMMLEQSGIRTAFGRSRRLVRGNWWRVFGVLLLGYVISQVLSGIITVPFAFLSMPFLGDDVGTPEFMFYLVNVLGSSLAGTISYPFAAGVVALVYVDLRMRREGLDLALARAAGAGTAAAPAAPSWHGTR